MTEKKMDEPGNRGNMEWSWRVHQKRSGSRKRHVSPAPNKDPHTRRKLSKYGTCEYHRDVQNQKEDLATDYANHIKEKNTVREIKKRAKERAKERTKEKAKERACTDPTFNAAVFDLQQVIYLPKSARSELFYKCRLANYYFTIFSLGTKQGTCYTYRMKGKPNVDLVKVLHTYRCTLYSHISVWSR